MEEVLDVPQLLLSKNSSENCIKMEIKMPPSKKIKMITPKVPYLQYEILEYYYLKPKESLPIYVGYPKDSKIVAGAINSLIRKGMLDKELKLTEKGLFFVKDKVDKRYEFPDYSNVVFDTKKIRAFQSEEKKHNRIRPIFRWYSYLEDFPGVFIEDSIKKYKLHDKYYVLDPFIGSGTTSIQAKLLGYKSIGIDISPLMTFVSRMKTNWSVDINSLIEDISMLVKSFKKLSPENKKRIFDSSSLKNMPKKELNQWLSPVKQYEIASMLDLINKSEISKESKDILLFITSTSAVNVSYVAFCPGTTFYPFRSKPDFLVEFVNLASKIIIDLKHEKVQENKSVETIISEGSSKEEEIFSRFKNKVDVILTSPPYPNDLEYTRQTRLELYLLEIVKNMEDVQKLKKKMIKGSTKLIYKEDSVPKRVLDVKSIKKITDEVAFRLKDKNWGFDYPKMIAQYFADMWTALENYHGVLVDNGTCILVVGDQTSKGVVIPVAEILAEIAKKVGFKEARIELHRKRRSTTHDISIPEENLILKK